MEIVLRSMGPGEGDTLLLIERSAGDRLAATGSHPATTPSEPSDFARFLVAHDVIVAEDAANGTILGYACGRDLGPLYWLAELAVGSAHVRRGVGTRLVGAVCAKAAARFHRAVGLTTYRFIEFNAPFYERCGFLAVSQQDHDDTLAERFKAEMPNGVRPETRCVMVRWL